MGCSWEIKYRLETLLQYLLLNLTNSNCFFPIPASQIGHSARGPRRFRHDHGPVLLGLRVCSQPPPRARHHPVLRRAEGEGRRGGLSAAEGELPQQPRLRPALHRPRHLRLLQLGGGDALGLGRRDCDNGHNRGRRGSSLSAICLGSRDLDGRERCYDPCQESSVACTCVCAVRGNYVGTNAHMTPQALVT